MHRDIDIVNAMREWMGFGNFTEDELEGLLELAGKSEGKITFENFTEFLLSDNNQ